MTYEEITCYLCGKVLVTADEQAASGAPSGETMPTMVVPAGCITEPADGHGRLRCGACSADEEVVEYMTDLDEGERVIAGLYEREAVRRKPTADEAAVDEQARLVFGVEPLDPDDYESLADTGP